MRRWRVVNQKTRLQKLLSLKGGLVLFLFHACIHINKGNTLLFVIFSYSDHFAMISTNLSGSKSTTCGNGNVVDFVVEV